jgi:hypothetical protein
MEGLDLMGVDGGWLLLFLNRLRFTDISNLNVSGWL